MRKDVLKHWVKAASHESKQKQIKRYEGYIETTCSVIVKLRNKQALHFENYIRTLEWLIKETQVKIDIVKNHDIIKNEIKEQYSNIYMERYIKRHSV